MATIAELGGLKSEGLLVQSRDWNSIVTEVVRLDADKANQTDFVALQTIVTALQTALGALQGTVTTLDQTVASLGGRVTALEAIRDHYYSMTLESPQQRYAVGNAAEIIARLHDLEGNPCTFPVTASRPSIDFVASWGALQAVAGFDSRAGADGRSMTVRVDANGVARVRLRYGSRVADQDQVVLGQVLQRMVMPAGGGGAQSVEALILNASTAEEARTSGAFSVIDAEYHGNAGVRRHVDTLFRDEQRGRYQVVDDFGTFTDYRATVLAFVKGDDDPRTPDATRGTSTTQITFREWTRVYSEPPVTVFPDDDPPVYWYPPVHRLPIDRERIVDDVKHFLDNVLDVEGEVDRHIRIRNTVEWLGQARAGAAGPDVVDAIDQAQSTLGLIAELDHGRASVDKGSGGVGALVHLAGRGENRAVAAHEAVRAESARATNVETGLGEVRQQVAALGGQVAATVAEGGTIHNALQQVGSLNARVNGLEIERFAPTETLVRDLRVQVSQATERIVRLERP